MIFEFQREGSEGDWEALGIARTGGDEFDLAEAVAALTATQALAPGSHRVRALEAERRWHFALVDEGGSFELVDQPSSPVASSTGAPTGFDSGEPRWRR